MKVFREALAAIAPLHAGRRWVYVPYDQLTDQVGLLTRRPPHEIGIVLVESLHKPARRPYHKRKLALVLANMRHFALEQARRGVAIHYVATRQPYAAALSEVASARGPLHMMRAAERELRVELQPLVERGDLIVHPHAGWLTTDADFGDSPGPWRMDAFYRRVRRRTGLLMVDGKPEGGRFSFDGENRKRWPGDPPAPALPSFPMDPIKAEVIATVRTRFADHPGSLDPSTLPATHTDAEALWSWALAECMKHFGPYEDAMSTASRTLFHTRISELVNLHRLLPARVVEDVATSAHPLPCREGFVRQVIGWREFVRHVHERTDGFRELPTPWESGRGPGAPAHLGAERPLPAAFWRGHPSGMTCLDTVVESVWDEAYSHHITRLMVLANLATMLDVSARELTDWFWVAYSDAYDWVVEPNVLGMGTFASGPVMTTKPYVSGSAYIHKMSDFCKSCAFHPKKTCPVTSLYWAFLDRNEPRLRDNPRMKLVLASLRRRAPDVRAFDQAVFTALWEHLSAGQPIPVDVLQRVSASP